MEFGLLRFYYTLLNIVRSKETQPSVDFDYYEVLCMQVVETLFILCVVSEFVELFVVV